MRLHRFKTVALMACAMTAASISLTTTAHAANSASTASHRSAALTTSCGNANANFGFFYYEADHARGLDWWAQGSGNSGNGHPVVLGNVSSSSPADCFHIEGQSGAVAYQLYQSALCLNIAGNSHSAGAWVILYPCTYSSNELFAIYDSGLNDGSITLRSVSSGLCVDLSAGYHAGSILEQKPCNYADPFQSWFPGR